MPVFDFDELEAVTLGVDDNVLGVDDDGDDDDGDDDPLTSGLDVSAPIPAVT